MIKKQRKETEGERSLVNLEHMGFFVLACYDFVAHAPPSNFYPLFLCFSLSPLPLWFSVSFCALPLLFRICLFGF